MNLNSPFWRFCEWFYAMPEPPPRERKKPMQVICVGFPRSGTESLQQALLALGYDYTYHGFDILFEEPLHLQGWSRLARRKWFNSRNSGSGNGGNGDCTITSADFDELLGHSVAVTDAAASCFAPEIIAAYPEAKVILNLRDLDKWHASALHNLCGKVNDVWSLYVLTWFNRELWWMWHVYERLLWHRLFRCTDSTLRSGIEASGKLIYREHSAMVRGMVPPERLLEWQVEDGWKPLCEFLGKEVPTSEFPRSNDAVGFQGRIDNILATQGKSAIRNLVITLTVFVGVGAAGWKLAV